MKHPANPVMVPIVALALSAAVFVSSPALAQDDQPKEEGLSLMEEGARLFFRGLMTEMEPALEELEDMAREIEPAFREFADQMGPALRDLMDKVEDWSVYHPPEILPNGDIILRKKTPDELADEGKEIDL